MAPCCLRPCWMRVSKLITHPCLTREYRQVLRRHLPSEIGISAISTIFCSSVCGSTTVTLSPNHQIKRQGVSCTDGSLVSSRRTFSSPSSHEETQLALLTCRSPSRYPSSSVLVHSKGHIFRSYSKPCVNWLAQFRSICLKLTCLLLLPYR